MLGIIFSLVRELDIPIDVRKNLFTILSNVSKWENPALRYYAFQEIGLLLSLYKTDPQQVAYHLREISHPSTSNEYQQDPWKQVQTLDVIVNFVSRHPEKRSLLETLSTAAILLVSELLVRYAGAAVGAFSGVEGRAIVLRTRGVASKLDESLDRITNPEVSNLINPTASKANCVGCVAAGDEFLETGIVRSVADSEFSVSSLTSKYGRQFSSQSTSLLSASQDLLAAGSGSRSIVMLRPLTADGIGHVVNAVNYNGEIIFIDFQEGLIWTSQADLMAWGRSQGLYYFKFLPTTPR